MALVVGTNCGFVTTAPTSDPGGMKSTRDYYATSMKVTTTDAITITEMGWWCDNATEEANFEVGIYSHDGDNNRPLTLLKSDTTNAKGTDLGWKVVTGLDWDLSASTTYWIAFQLDNTATGTDIDLGYPINGEAQSYDNNVSSLPATGAGYNTFTRWLVGVYAVWEEAAAGTNTQINIGDDWKEISAAQINIGDVWKEVAGIQINIGDTWKEVF